MMRFVVTESTQDFVTLEKELGYIHDYIELQKLRIDDDNLLDFTVTGEAMNKEIAPLLLIPFIENAFKYGVNPDEESVIKIAIEIDEKSLHLYTKNEIVVTAVSENLKSEKGLENTQKRLNYLYANKHTLSIVNDGKTYVVHLKIELV